jgi:Fe-S cluster assembly iron-binding protein IscA
MLDRGISPTAAGSPAGEERSAIMVEISRGATELLNAVRSAEGIPDSYGVRFYSEKDPAGGTAVGIAFAQGPRTGDEVSVAQELPVYIAPEVAPELGDAVLDVDAGSGPPRFVIRA